MKTADLAIVIPAFKARFLSETLTALASQTCKRFVCYIADDASPHDLISVVSRFHTAFPMEYKHFDTNLGANSLSQHWSRSIDMTRDERWIWLLCDDDIPASDCVERFYETVDILDENDISVYRQASVIIDEHSKAGETLYTHPGQESPSHFISRKMQGVTRSSLSEHIFRRSAYNLHGFVNFPLAWHTDDVAWVSFANRNPIFSNNDAIVKIRLSNETISGNSENIALKYSAAKQFLQWLLDTPLLNKAEMTSADWLAAYYNLESYIVNKHVSLTPRVIKDLWLLRIRCVGFWQSLKMIKLVKLYFR